jgi:RND superfamily putative drug exporter
MLFCILFGLSMDYEVFLLSRIREFRDRGHSTPESVALGLERTGGIITGAAVIMIVVFSAFALSPIIIVKEIGFSLAVAVLLDATIIRILLVPSLMRVLGPLNWWLPAPLKKILPPLSLEAEEEEPLPTRHQ